MPDPQSHHHDPRLDNPIVKEAVRSWYASLANHDLNDLGSHLEALGVVLVLLAKLSPVTRPALTSPSDDEFKAKLESWKRALRDLLSADLGNGTTR
ncbi:MAG: hypothetical protein ACRD21_27600 [Vicinamibacteria bacterium]